MKNLSIPRPFCFNKNNIKAFVLGADPTNFSNKGKTVVLSTVFSIGDGDPRYFQDILKNLKAIGLSLETVYVQNLIGEYLDEETSQKKDWESIADLWLAIRIKEFNILDRTKKIPVLVTAERILNYLLVDENKIKAEEYYSLKASIPIKENKLQRPIIPFYRHYNYSLIKDSYGRYRNYLKNKFE